MEQFDAKTIDLIASGFFLAAEKCVNTHLMENAIYNELRRQGFNVDVGVVIDKNGVSYRKQLEVDFVCNKGSRRCYIQSALSLASQEKVDQETNSLRRIDDGFERIVVVGDHLVSNHDINGILFVCISMSL